MAIYGNFTRIILQGTDGIRGEARLSHYPQVIGMRPVDAFSEKGIITEEFMELYIYSHIKCMMADGLIKENDRVVIGWDPRDKNEDFISRAVDGIRRAGADVLKTGIVPTPLIPLFMIYQGAKCGIMITASHNPYDQNGIKIFISPYAIKMLPENDAILSSALFKEDFAKMMSIPKKGKVIDCRDEALDVFEEFLCNSKNSWIPDKDILSKMIVIIDCANGSYSSFASRVFKRLGIKEVIEVNNDLDDGKVNETCGVVELENLSVVTPEMVYESTGRLYQNIAIRRLFEIGRKNREYIISRRLCAAACVFDADGDRVYRLDYNPVKDQIIVLNGDVTACHQIRYLASLYKKNMKGSLCVNTIESDLYMSQEAQKFGFNIRLTAVGDKWILWWTAVSLLKSIAYFCMNNAKTRETERLSILIQEKVDELENSEDNRIKRLTACIDEIASLRKYNSDFCKIIKEAEKNIACPGNIKFAVGSERSGHTITFGYLKMKNGAETPVFSGNGIKSAINTFVAAETLYSHMALEEYFNVLHHPFPDGFKKTFYLYYTNKSLLKRDTNLWTELNNIINKEGEKCFTDKEIRPQFFPDDPDLLYIGVFNKTGYMIAGVYVRNSGTEDKTSVNVMGRLEDKDALASIGLSVFKYLLINMKDQDREAVKLENRILSKIYNKSENSCLQDELDDDDTDGLIKERILKIMEAKEGLINRDKDGFSLTDLGKWYCSSKGSALPFMLKSRPVLDR